MPHLSRRPVPDSRRATRRLMRALTMAIWMVLLAGCKTDSHSPDEKGVAVVVPAMRATFIRNFNPYFESHARWPTAAGIYEPTIIFNRATGEFVPWLAEQWWWTDENTELVLKIREGVRWADGKPLTAEDVEYTFQLMREYDALDQSSIWKHAASIQARGRNVHFRFKHPFTTPVLYMVGKQPIVPKHIWKNIDDPVRFPNENPIGSGPYNQVLSFRSQVYEIGANPDYWQKGKPGLKKFRLPALGGNEAQALALIRGDLDWAAVFLPAIDRIFVEKDPKHRGYYFPSLEGTVMLYANTKVAPFDRANVRKALSHAIDRKLIVCIAMQNYTRPADATGFSDLYDKWHDPKVLEEEGDWTRYNPDKAAAMLDAAGLRKGPRGLRTMPDGTPLTVDVNCVVGWSDWIIAAEIIVKNLRAVGIDATMRTYAYGAWFNKLQMGNFQLSMSWSDGAATPWSFYQRQMSRDTYRPLGEAAENNWQRFVSQRADALLEQFASTADFKEQKRIASELQREFVRRAPAIPLFPGPTWGQFNSKRVVGFPSADHPYAPLAPYKAPGQLLSMVELRPRGTPPLSDNPGEGAPGRGHVAPPEDPPSEDGGSKLAPCGDREDNEPCSPSQAGANGEEPLLDEPSSAEAPPKRDQTSNSRETEKRSSHPSAPRPLPLPPGNRSLPPEEARP